MLISGSPGLLVLALVVRVQVAAGACTARPDTLGVVKSAISAISGARGRCSLAELGEHLRTAGVSLPEDTSLQEYIMTNSEAGGLKLSGRRNNRQVALVSHTTEATLVERVKSVLLVHGPMSSAELRLRLRAERASVPGLSSLVRANPATFEVSDGIICLTTPAATAPRTGVTAPPNREVLGLSRLRAIDLPQSLDAAVEARLGSIQEVILLDLDNRALLALERAVESAVARDDTLLLACCSAAHNPRLPARLAERMNELASRGALRLLTPLKDVTNGADFVLAFWVGFLHARLRPDVPFVLVSEDISLERTVADVLSGNARAVRSNPPELLDAS